MAQGGDITNSDGTGGMSIYGKAFRDENFVRKHDQPGLLSMANSGPNTNGSQFFILFKAAPWLDGRHVVFGRVLPPSMSILGVLEKVRTGKNDVPLMPVRVAACGIVESSQSTSIGAISVSTSSSSASTSSPSSGGISKKEAFVKSIKLDAAKPQQDEKVKDSDDDPIPEVSDPSSSYVDQTAHMSAAEKRLFKLRLQMNQARKSNRAEVEHEFRRSQEVAKSGSGAGGAAYDARRRQQERQVEEQQKRVKQAQGGVGTEPAQCKILHTTDTLSTSSSVAASWGLRVTSAELAVTAAEAEILKQRQEEKGERRATLGMGSSDLRDRQFAAYEKRLAKWPSAAGGGGGGSGGGRNSADSWGGTTPSSTGLSAAGANIGSAGAARVAQDVAEKHAAIDSRNRKRATAHVDADATNVESINATNAAFNKRLKQSFDKYTLEIRQNLERGTAL